MCSFKHRLQMVMFQTICRAFRLLFDSAAQLSYVSPKVKAFLNLEIKGKREVALKMFRENTSNKVLEVVELQVFF